MAKLIKIEKGDVSANGQVTIVDEDRLCYLVKSFSKGATGLRTISKALFEIEKCYKRGITDRNVLFDTAISVLDKNLELEYIEFRNFETFEKTDKIIKNTLVAIAAKVGKTRLIDNIVI